MRSAAWILVFWAAFSAQVYASSVGAAASALAPFASHKQGRLFSLQGSNTVGERLAPELVRDYMQEKGLVNVSIKKTDVENEYKIVGYHPNSSRSVSVDVAAHGSSTAFIGLITGEADIGMSSRPINDSEVEALKPFGDMRSFEAEKVVAIDGLAVIVHPDSPVSELTLDQIGQIFAGQISDWQEVGGAPGSIHLYARDNKSGTWDTFKNLVLGKKYLLNPSARRFESNDEISRLVQRDPNGIGFIGLASVGGAKALAVSDTNTRALLPTLLSVATEDYILARRLFMYVPPTNQSPVLREFINFVQSEAAQDRVGKVGYVAQNPIGLPTPNLDHASETYRELVEDAERLSINFRFREGSAELDNKAQQDILRLSRFMQKPENAERQLLLIGFGDVKQTERRAQILSQLRAVAVRSALRDHGLNTLPVQGLGAQFPVADNDSAGKLKNQRVEIWLI